MRYSQMLFAAALTSFLERGTWVISELDVELSIFIEIVRSINDVLIQIITDLNYGN